MRPEAAGVEDGAAQPLGNGVLAGPSGPIRVLVVDDSPSARELLVYILTRDPRFQVVGLASDGRSAWRLAQRIQPDVITMDIHMPHMDGYAAIESIMQTCPTRIVVVTNSARPRDVLVTFQALEVGALAVVASPVGIGHPQFEATAQALLRTLQLMSEVKVVRRWAKQRDSQAKVDKPPEIAPVEGNFRLVVMGASTGGPLALQSILSKLPSRFSVPILIVQHLPPDFSAGFVAWLARASGFPVKLAEQGEPMLAGQAYVAPGNSQLAIGPVGTLQLVPGPPENGLCPAVSHLFRSALAVYGAGVVGVLLTGMGQDGAQELMAMHQAGALTIAQDKDSAVVYGMPGEAVRLGAARYILAPDAIATTLTRLIPAAR